MAGAVAVKPVVYVPLVLLGESGAELAQVVVPGAVVLIRHSVPSTSSFPPVTVTEYDTVIDAPGATVVVAAPLTVAEAILKAACAAPLRPASRAKISKQGVDQCVIVWIACFFTSLCQGIVGAGGTAIVDTGFSTNHHQVDRSVAF